MGVSDFRTKFENVMGFYFAIFLTPFSIGIVNNWTEVNWPRPP